MQLAPFKPNPFHTEYEFHNNCTFHTKKHLSTFRTNTVVTESQCIKPVLSPFFLLFMTVVFVNN